MKPYIWRAFFFTVACQLALFCFLIAPFTLELPTREQRMDFFFSTSVWLIVATGLVIGPFWYWFFWFSQGRYEP